jgi:catechol 2,3-dioxygenase-like lactoylglutathione lyase family enzyme
MSVGYIMIGVNDLDKGLAFWGPLLETMKWSVAHDYAGITRGYSDGTGKLAWVSRPNNREPVVPANGTMIGFHVADRATVDAVHAMALAAGGSCEGPPGPRPLYGPDFYGAYFRDPDGNKFAVVLG